MKITAFILLAFCLHVSATTLAQNVTLREHKAPLEKVINEIKHQPVIPSSITRTGCNNHNP